MFRRRFLAFALVVTVAACGGGGGGSSSNAPALPNAGTTPPPGTLTTGRATLTIVVPKATSSSGTRRTKYVAANTRAVKFTLLKTDSTAATPGPQTFPVDATQTYCTTTTAGLSCVLSINAPVGNDIFQGETFSDAAATQKIGGGAIALSIQQNASNSATITLGGPVAIATLVSPYADAQIAAYASPAPPVPTGPQPTSSSYYNNSPTYSSVRAYVIALDVNGNPVLSPDTYSTPVYLTLVSEYASSNYGYGSSARQPQNVPNDKTADPTAIMVVNVVHTDGTVSATSTGNRSVAVNAPGDVITVSANPTFSSPYNNQHGVYVSVTVGGPAVPDTNGYYSTHNSLYFPVRPSVCPDGWTGTEPSTCQPTPAPSPTPSPVPTPCPSPGTQFGPSCVVPQFSWIPNASGTETISGTDASWEFPSLHATNVAYFALGLTDTSYNGPITLAATSAGEGNGPCANLLFAPDGGSTPTLAVGSGTITINSTGNGASYSPYTWYLRAALTGSPAAGFTCHLVLTGEGNAHATLEISANNVTGGTVQ